MKRGNFNYLIDVLLFLAIILVGITGILKFPDVRHFLNFHPRLLFHQIHDWSGLAIVVLSIIHIILHWKFLVSKTKLIFKKK